MTEYMSNITNNFEPGSVTMNAGSSMNGDVHIGNVYNGKADVKTEEKDSLSIGSPLHLSKKATKIDLIRVMNAWYECGKVEDGSGAKLTKKEFFTWVGKLFNIDLSTTTRICLTRCKVAWLSRSSRAYSMN